MPVKKDGEFIFPLKESYEKTRNTVAVPTQSDTGAKADSNEHPHEVQMIDSHQTTSPLNIESDKLNDMSPVLIENDSGPKGGGEDKLSEQNEETETIELAPQETNATATAHKPMVGFDESYGLKTRKKKGSQRPPDIPGVVWVSLSPKQRQECIDSYQRTGSGWPKRRQAHLLTT